MQVDEENVERKKKGVVIFDICIIIGNFIKGIYRISPLS